MSKRMLILFLLLAVIPLGLLGWLGVRVGVEDESQVKSQLRNVLMGRLQDTRSQIIRSLGSMERTFLKAFTEWESKQEALNKMLRSPPNKQKKRTKAPKQIKQNKEAKQGKVPKLKKILSLGSRFRRHHRQLRRFSLNMKAQGLRPKKKSLGGPFAPLAQVLGTPSAVELLLQKDGQRRLMIRQRNLALSRQMFWVAPSGRVLYPDRSKPLTPQEKAFMDRTKSIWERKAILSQHGAVGSRRAEPTKTKGAATPKRQGILSAPSSGVQLQLSGSSGVNSGNYGSYGRTGSSLHASNANRYGRANAAPNNYRSGPQQASRPSKQLPAPVKQGKKKRGDSIVQLAAGRSHGWLVWFWEEGIHLLFWKRLKDGGVIGAEVDRIVLMSHVIGTLPDTRDKSQKQTGRIVLNDEKGAPIYQWGQYKSAKGEQPLAKVELAYPLHAWHLRYYGPEHKQFAALTGRIRVQMIMVLLLVGLGFLAMLFYLYREYSRDMREAAQRMTFVTQVSHELKTPLTNIRLYAELLENKLTEEQPRAKRNLQVIVDESQRLSRLINNILTFARQRRKVHKLRPTKVAVVAFLERIVEQFQPQLKAKGFSIEMTHQVEGEVLADPDALEQILCNLLSNVEKYATEGQWVGIKSIQEEQMIHIEVCDHGPGVEPAMQKDIFQPFVRGRDKLSDVAGTGIGLTIARDLARMQEGDLALCASEEGACFRLSLPKA